MNISKELEKLISERVYAIKNKDVEKATVRFSGDIILYDVVDPLVFYGIESLKSRLKSWLDTLSVINNFEISVKEIKFSNDLAYCISLNHIDAINQMGERLDMWWRETTCYTKDNENWMITHAHSSVPFNPETGKASLSLIPV